MNSSFFGFYKIILKKLIDKRKKKKEKNKISIVEIHYNNKPTIKKNKQTIIKLTKIIIKL
jgi:hypothetical protein